MYFLSNLANEIGYYQVGLSDNEGIIEALYDDGGISTKKCLELVDKVLDKAITIEGIKDSVEYQELKQIYDYCHGKENDLDLDTSAKKTWAWWLGWCFGIDYDYKEVLDQKLEALYIKITKTQNA